MTLKIRQKVCVVHPQATLPDNAFNANITTLGTARSGYKGPDFA